MPSGSTTSVVAWPPSAVPRSPSRPPPTSSACGPCRSSRSATLAPHTSSSSSTGSTGKHSRRATRSSPETPFTTRSGIASTPWPAGLLKLPGDMTRCPTSPGRSVSRSRQAGPSWPKVRLEPRSSRHSTRSSDTRAWGTPSSRGVPASLPQRRFSSWAEARRQRRCCPRPHSATISKTSCTTPRHESGSRLHSSDGRKRRSTAGERQAGRTCSGFVGRSCTRWRDCWRAGCWKRRKPLSAEPRTHRSTWGRRGSISPKGGFSL